MVVGLVLFSRYFAECRFLSLKHWCGTGTAPSAASLALVGLPPAANIGRGGAKPWLIDHGVHGGAQRPQGGAPRQLQQRAHKRW